MTYPTPTTLARPNDALADGGPHPVGQRADEPVAINARARAAYLDSVSTGSVLTGRQLGEMFGRSERWGRDRIREARDLDPSPPTPAPTPGPQSRVGQNEKPETTPPTAGSKTNGKPAAATRGKPTTQPVQRARQTSEGRHAGVPAVTPAVRRVTSASVIVVAVVAAVVSYEHMRHLAADAGEGWRAFLLPLAVDGLMLAASMAMLVRKRQGRPTGALSWSALLAGIFASLAANIAAAEPTLTGRLVAAWPPIALLLAYELLMQQVRTAREETTR